MQKIENLLKIEGAGKAVKAGKGSAGFDNARENIDPHILTSVVDTKEIILGGDRRTSWPSAGTNDHTALSNIGAQTHAQIDTNIIYTTDHLSIQKSGGSNVYVFENSVSGQNPQMRIYGYADLKGTPVLTYAFIYVGHYGEIIFDTENLDQQVVFAKQLLCTNPDGLGVGIYYQDSTSVYFGQGIDAEIFYDGTDLKINPKRVGTGKLNVMGKVLAEGYAAADASEGISTTITTASLVGKTITVKNGLITGFA